MKTIREHLNELPEPYRTEALENYNGSSKKKHKEVQVALALAFVWMDTKQGYNYWNDFTESL